MLEAAGTSNAMLNAMARQRIVRCMFIAPFCLTLPANEDDIDYCTGNALCRVMELAAGRIWRRWRFPADSAVDGIAQGSVSQPNGRGDSWCNFPRPRLARNEYVRLRS